MKSSAKKYLVFISHSGEDTWVAQQIAREIKAAGADVFLDAANIKIGDEFEEDILKSLDIADELLVLFTPWALERPYVLAEIGAAWSRRIPIVTVLHGLSIAEFRGRPNLPIFLIKRDMIKLNDIDQYFSQLRARGESENRHE
ncbi:MAG TPA: toll/interleukin-1 receptor domain-containing protein [Phototrophicaceae bacterium]|nr:toll/interleukin-1 receptor domain-containing protein [Phototrophicaceae bacterium]